MTKVVYRRPAVVEAVCEVTFQDSHWDDSLQGRFAAEIGGEYPTQRDVTIVQAHMTMDTQQPEKSHSGILPLEKRVQYISQTADYVIQVGRDIVVLHRLRPYGRFEEWSPEVLKMVSLYRDVAQPRALRELNLRYLNRIELPGTRVELQNYFSLYPHIPEAFEQHGPFLIRVQINPHPSHQLVLTLASAPPESADSLAFALDLLDRCHDVDFSTLEQELNRAHEHVVLAFEESCTDLLKNTFEPEAST